MSTVSDVLTQLIRDAALAAGHGEAPVPLEPVVATTDIKFGDYQSNFAFRLGKALRTNPRAVATAIVDVMPEHPAVAKVEVAGPGFINLFLDEAWLADELVRAVSDPRLDGPTPGAGKSLVIDYSSPNIAKRMHVGHMRSTIIGNALDRMFRYLGYEVIADNHVGDWGTQFGKLIVAWHRWRDEAAYAEDPIAELQRIYKKFGEAAEEDGSLIELARAETAKLQAGDAENRALWSAFVQQSMKEFDAVYERLGVHFDVTLGESFYRDVLDDLVEGLLEKGIAEVDSGAVIVPFEAADGKGLAKSPLLVRKSDGASLYGTTDLATVQHRVNTWDPDVFVYVTDVRQQLHFRQVFAACRKMGFDRDFRHVWFGILTFADGTPFASRGKSVNLVDLLNEAVKRARDKVDERSAELDEAERAEIAEAVGVGAVRYSDLSQNPQSGVTFDLDRMLALEGNTAPYLMYAHARCRSILRRAGVDNHEPAGVSLVHPLERELAMKILQLPDAVALAAHTARPNMLCDHVYEIASVFARFYGQCPVLKDGVSADVRASRLGLVGATARAMALGLDLLGIRALHRM